MRKLLESSTGTRPFNERCGEGGQFALMHAATLGHTAIVQARYWKRRLVWTCYATEAAPFSDVGCSKWPYFRRACTAGSLGQRGPAQQWPGRIHRRLMWAAWYGRTAIVRRRALLQASASVGLQSKLGYTALMIAARNGHTAIVQVLLTAGVGQRGPAKQRG